MGKITEEIIKEVYSQWKKYYKKEITRERYIEYMGKEFGMASSSASFYLEALISLKSSKCFKKTVNKTALNYFLEQLSNDYGISALRGALNSIKEHINYLEELGYKSKYQLEIYNKWLIKISK